MAHINKILKRLPGATALVLLGLCLVFGGGREVQAAKKNTLVTVKATSKEKKQGYTVRYKYYDAKGKKVKNAWVTLKVNGAKVRMYFGSDGKAYQAPTSAGFLNNVKTYKIGSATYGFDILGRAAKGYVANANIVGTKYYYFTSAGKYKSSKTKAFRAAIQSGITKNTDALLTLLKAPKEKKDVVICLGDEWEGELWTYSDLLQIQIKRNVGDGTTMIMAASAAMEGL